jgi:hypothetical protein
MNSSFKNKKELRFTLTLNDGQEFNAKGDNVVTLKGFRATADIDKAGGMQMTTASCRIFGVGLDAMQKLTALAWDALSSPAIGTKKNSIKIEAIDGDIDTTVFIGDIINAWPEFQSSPDVDFYVECQAGFINQVAPVPPTSYNGDVDVVALIKKLSGDMGYTFEVHGVTGITLSNPYLANTGLEQVKTAVTAAGLDWYLDDDVLAICKKGVPRLGTIPVITPDTGLIGYPTWDKVGVTFKTLYNPAIRFGGQVKIETMVKRAAGSWIVQQVSHNLSSETINGPWFSTIRCTESGLVPIS